MKPDWAEQTIARVQKRKEWSPTSGFMAMEVVNILRAERARARRKVRHYIKELEDIDRYEQGDTGWQRIALEELLRRLQ